MKSLIVAATLALVSTSAFAESVNLRAASTANYGSNGLYNNTGHLNDRYSNPEAYSYRNQNTNARYNNNVMNDFGYSTRNQNIVPTSTSFSPNIVDTQVSNVNGTVTDHYKNVVVKTPYQQEVCTQGNVNTDPNVFGLDLEGAIIGGIIGNNVTKNVENGGAAGAIIGGLIGSQNKGQVGTRCQVVTRYNEDVQKVYSHSTMTFVENGREYTVTFKKQ
jgi:uncharacterized protein YcfJ